MVSVSNGEVTLSGFVCTRTDKQLAGDLAASCLGIVRVHNDIGVKVNQRDGE